MVGDIFLQFCSISYEDKITSSRKSVLLANCSYFWEDLLHLCSYKMAFENSWYNIYIYILCNVLKRGSLLKNMSSGTDNKVFWAFRTYSTLCYADHLYQPSLLVSAIFVVSHLCWCQPSLLLAIFVDVSHLCCRPSLLMSAIFVAGHL